MTGMAPEAKWIACEVFGPNGEEIYPKLCTQWAMCPFRNNDPDNKDCSKAPDIVKLSPLITSYKNYEATSVSVGILLNGFMPHLVSFPDQLQLRIFSRCEFCILQ